MVSISKLLTSAFVIGTSPTNPHPQLAIPQQFQGDEYSAFKYFLGAGPYTTHSGYGIDPAVPSECELEQVQLLARHGERFPSHGEGQNYEKIMDKFHNYTNAFAGPLSFLNDYEYFVPAKELYDMETTASNSEGTFSGTNDAMRHGLYFRSRYESIYNSSQPLNVFTVNSFRVHQTADYFVRGFLGDDRSLPNWVVLSEEEDLGANSLTPKYSCSNYNHGKRNDLIGNYDSSYLKKILHRLIKDNQGLQLSTGDVDALFFWCAYETNVRGSLPFCNLFTNEEIIRHSYGNDLSRYYTYGNGNNISLWASSQLLNSSLTLLTQEDPPSNNGKIWLSFTHDTDIESFHASLGILQPKDHLPSDQIIFPSPYQVTSVVPQHARTYTEKYKCNGESYVRYLVNDAVIPIPNCTDGPGFSCKLQDFKNYVDQRIGDADYETMCDNQDSGRPPKLTFYWDYPDKNYTEPLDKTY